jgi:hypothetical protein
LMDRRVLPVLLDRRGPPALLALMDRQARLVLPVLLDRPVRPALLAFRV